MFYPYVSEKAIKNVEEVLRSRWIGQGKKVEEFEAKFKEKFGLYYAVAINCGSSAVRLALALVGVGPGDEVITTAQCCTATNHPILEQFATPVFADIQYLTGNINPDDIEHRITDKTKAVLCFHWGGYPCDMDEIITIAKKYNLTLIEDAVDALGASYKGKPIGVISRFTAFSFQAIQQITTGEGGMLVMLAEGDYKAAMWRRWYGIDRVNRQPNITGYYDFDITEPGYGYHMTNIAAAIGLAHLSDFDILFKKRADIVKIYRQELQGVSGVTLFQNRSDRTSGNHLFTIHVENRNDFCKMMRAEGIEVSIVHMRNDIYSVFGGKCDDLPVLDKFTGTNISIPLHNRLTNEDIEKIIKSIRKGW